MSRAKKAPIGFSGDTIYIVEGGYQGQDVVVKTSFRHEVLEEGKNLIWLKRYTKVPKVYQMGYLEGQYYTIMEKLPGVMFQELFKTCTPRNIVIMYAKLIKEFHTIDYTGLPYNHDLSQKLEAAKDNVLNHKVKEQYFERELTHLNASQLYDLLLQYQDDKEDKVLCHGDVCMPNIIMEQNELSGFIDIIGIGVCNRYLDIAIALRTLRYNFELYGLSFTSEYQDLFCQEYGLLTLDKHKVIFYILLDELTNG